MAYLGAAPRNQKVNYSDLTSDAQNRLESKLQILVWASSGSSTWTAPTGVTRVVAEVWGGGGTRGASGGSSSFGSFCSATGGGSGAITGTNSSPVYSERPNNGGSGSGGDINLTGVFGAGGTGDGVTQSSMGGGGGAPFGGAGGTAGYDDTPHDGAIPGGGGNSDDDAYGGGGGGYSKEVCTVVPGTSYTVTVGAGGNGGNATNQGYGATGAVRLTYVEPKSV